MNPTPDHPLSRGAAPAPVPAVLPAAYEETLRLITHPPVPAGLPDRVHAALLQAAPLPLRVRILAWPASVDAGSGWMRAAAAAAIVFVVAGGGWGVYQRVQRPAAKVIVMPAAQPAATGAFSSAGAMRTPQTVKGPAVAAPAAAAPVPLPSAKASRVRTRRKARPAAAAPVSGAAVQPVSAPAAAAAGK